MTKKESMTLYLALLSHPLDEWRINNQAIYCLALKEVAPHFPNRSTQSVQDLFENVARTSKILEMMPRLNRIV